MMYTVRVIKNRGSEKVYSCSGYDVSILPDEGPFSDKPEELGIPEGQNVKLVLKPENKTICLPRDGKEIYVTNGRDPVDHFPRKKKEFRVVNREGGE